MKFCFASLVRLLADSVVGCLPILGEEVLRHSHHGLVGRDVDRAFPVVPQWRVVHLGVVLPDLAAVHCLGGRTVGLYTGAVIEAGGESRCACTGVLEADQDLLAEWERLCRREKRYTWPTRPVLFDELEALCIEAGLKSPLMYFHRSPGLLRLKARKGKRR